MGYYMVDFIAPSELVLDFILEPLFMRRLDRMVARSLRIASPLPIVPLFVVPLFMVPVPIVPLFMVPVVPVVLGVWFMVPDVVVPGVVWAKAAVVPRAKAAARKREVAFMISVEKLVKIGAIEPGLLRAFTSRLLPDYQINYRCRLPKRGAAFELVAS